MNKRNVGLLLLSLTLCYSTAFIGSLATLADIPTWYTTINKPFFNPPNWLFAPVWTLLYTLMAISLFYVFKSENPAKANAILLFGTQLIFNALWSLFFFKYHWLAVAAVESFLLMILIIMYLKTAAKIEKIHYYLIVPYIFWVAFATILTISIAWLNS